MLSTTLSYLIKTRLDFPPTVFINTFLVDFNIPDCHFTIFLNTVKIIMVFLRRMWSRGWEPRFNKASDKENQKLCAYEELEVVVSSMESYYKNRKPWWFAAFDSTQPLRQSGMCYASILSLNGNNICKWTQRFFPMERRNTPLKIKGLVK